MGSVKTWSTKEEVLKDLARASGGRFRKKQDLDTGYLVIGDAPPPVIIEDEDHEMQLLFGEAATRKGVPTEDVTPDLLGIQQMLRMVQEYDTLDDDNIRTNDVAESSDCVIAISKITKLNPNVKEFIPKGASSSSVSTSSNKDTGDSSNTNVVTQTDNVVMKDSGPNDTAVDNTDIDKGVNKTKENEYQDIAIKLKNEISDAAKSDSFEFKKQKNVAIATLLKLYAANQKLPEKSTMPIKLITPEYFEGKKDESTDANIDSVTTALRTVPSQMSTSSTPEPKNSSTTVPSRSSNSISSTPLRTSVENNLNETKTKTSDIKIDPEMKRSIEKVNKWLEEPTKRKSPAVCLGPIAFKRKEPTCTKSPIKSTEQKVSKPSAEGQRYQPSNYAADLGKKYMERNEIKENLKNNVTWSNLEEKLKEKDSLIKKRLEEQASASDSNDSVVPQR